MKKFVVAAALLLVGAVANPAAATTPSGGWTLLNPSPSVKDQFFRIDVDPGEYYSVAGYAPSSVY